jgi:hypothetical protein
MISALAEDGNAVIDLVAEVVLEEEPGMQRRNDDQLQTTHCHLQYQMSPVKSVVQLILNDDLL